VDFYADWHDASSPPDVFEVVMDGTSYPMTLLWGAGEDGVFHTSLSVPAGCHEYYFRGVLGAAETRFPEDGSYGWGGCAFDDVGAEWFATQLAPAPPISVSTTDWVVGGSTTVTAVNAEDGETVMFVRGTGMGPGPCPGLLGGLCLDLTGAALLGSAVADATGTAELTFTVPGFVPDGMTVTLQAVIERGSGGSSSVKSDAISAVTEL